jgi:ATP-binding cassette, subfamily B, bacterial PglK
MKKMIQYAREIIYLIGQKDRKRVPILFILFIFGSILDLVSIGLIAPYISLVINPAKAIDGPLGKMYHKTGFHFEAHDLVAYTGSILLLIFLLKALFTIWIYYRIAGFSQMQQLNLRTTLMKAYQGLSYNKFLHRNSSEYIHNIHTLANEFAGTVWVILNLLSQGLVAGVIIILLAMENLIVLISLIILFGLFIIIYDRFFRFRMGECGRLINLATQLNIRSINEGIEGFKEIRILGKGSYFLNKVKHNSNEIRKYATLKSIIQISPSYMLEFSMVLFVVSFVTISTYLLESFTTIVPTLGMFGVAAFRLKPIANALSTGLGHLRYSRYGTKVLYDDLKNIQQFNTNTINTKVSANNPFEKIELKNISFSYPLSNHQVIEEVSLEISRGDSIGFIGSSGSGKTTLIDLMLGLLKPQTGEIVFNGRSFSEEQTIKEWFSKIAYLPQQIFLIDDTLRNNVALGVEENMIDDHRLNNALLQARLKDFVELLPEGSRTLIGERGIRISGGQRQRVALARAFYHQRSVLVMDEATSALDSITEEKIINEIEYLKGKVTMIVIAHRLTTLKHCDRIYTLEQGRIVNVGIPGSA